MDVEEALQRDLTELCKREELLWKDKAKARWIEEGDANTNYFHLSTVIHMRYNSINKILNSYSNWISDKEGIGKEFEGYSQDLFTSDRPNFPIGLQNLLQPIVDDNMNQILTTIPSGLEIQKALMKMGNLKSPGPDGLNALF